MAEILTFPQADLIYSERLRMEAHCITFGDWAGTIYKVLRETGSANPAWPFFWEPPEVRAKAKAKGAGA